MPASCRSADLAPDPELLLTRTSNRDNRSTSRALEEADTDGEQAGKGGIQARGRGNNRDRGVDRNGARGDHGRGRGRHDGGAGHGYDDETDDDSTDSIRSEPTLPRLSRPDHRRSHPQQYRWAKAIASNLQSVSIYHPPRDLYLELTIQEPVTPSVKHFIRPKEKKK